MHQDLPEPVVPLLQQSCEWRLLGLLFECPRPGWSEEMAALAGTGGSEPLRAAASSARVEASEGLYHTTFGPGGPAAPREVSYRVSAVPGRFLGQLRGLYEAFQYRPTNGDPPDHVAVEAGFVAYLRLKQAYAESRGDTPGGAACSTAATRVVDEHLSWIARPLSQSLQQSGIRHLALAAAELYRHVGDPRQATATPLPLNVLHHPRG